MSARRPSPREGEQQSGLDGVGDLGRAGLPVTSKSKILA